MFLPRSISSFYSRQALAREAFQGAELSMFTCIAVKLRCANQERKIWNGRRVVAKGGIEPPTQGFSDAKRVVLRIPTKFEGI
jgi:hypothetical protein